jgi:hypothetical protein
MVELPLGWTVVGLALTELMTGGRVDGMTYKLISFERT